MNGWISVKERLPDKLQKVLFHWVCPGGNRNISMGYLCNEGWDIYLPYHSYKMNPKILKVTHWMNLPLFPEYEITRFEGSVMIDDPYCLTDEEATHYGSRKAKEFIENLMQNHQSLFKRLADK